MNIKKMMVILVICISHIYSISIERYTAHSISEVQKHIDSHTLFIFDIDNTLILDDEYNQAVVILEPQISHSLFKKLHSHNIPVISITARETDQPDFTLQEMKQFNFNFTDLYRSQSSFSCILLNDTHNKAFYNRGIIFVEGSNKGEALKAFLNSIQEKPTTIVMIDDMPYNLDDMENTFKNIHISGIQRIILYDYPYVKDRLANQL